MRHQIQRRHQDAELRAYYRGRQRRAAQRQRILDGVQWVIVAGIAVALAFSVYAGLQSQEAPAYPTSLPAFEELP